MSTSAAPPIVLSMVVVMAAGCAARMEATPASAPSAAAPQSSPRAVPNATVASEQPVDPPPAPLETSSVAARPAVASAPLPPATTYVFTPDQVATAPPPPPRFESPASEPAAAGKESSKAIPGELRLAVVASVRSIAAGAIVSVDVVASSRSSVVDAPLHLVFDPSVLEFVDGAPGSFLAQGGSSIVFLADGTSVPGDVAVAAGRVEREHGASGDGLLCRVRFRGIGAGTSAVIVSEAKVWGTDGEALTVLAGRADVVVR